MPTCPACGGEITEGANLCDHCGQPLAEEDIGVYKVKDPSAGPLFEVRIRQYFKTGWCTFRQYLLGFLGFGLLIGIVSTILMKFPKIPFVGTAIFTILQAGIFIVSAKLLQCQNHHFSDFFSGFHYFRPLFTYSFIYYFLEEVPIYLAKSSYPFILILFSGLIDLAFILFFFFTPLLIIDRRLGLWEAMKLSQLTVQRRWWQFLGIMLLLGLIFSIISLIIFLLMELIPASLKSQFEIFALLIFILVTLPLISCILTAAYVDLFGLQSKEY